MTCESGKLNCESKSKIENAEGWSNKASLACVKVSSAKKKFGQAPSFVLATHLHRRVWDCVCVLFAVAPHLSTATSLISAALICMCMNVQLCSF